MKKIIMGLCCLSASFVASADCTKYEHVIETSTWIRNQMVESKIIYVSQVLGDLIILDKYQMVIDASGYDLSTVAYGDSLYHMFPYLGRVGDIDLTTTRGFSVSKALYVPVTRSVAYSCPKNKLWNY